MSRSEMTNRLSDRWSVDFIPVKTAGRLMLMFSTCLVLGCGKDQGPTVQKQTETKPEKPMETVLKISRIEDGQEWRIGTLTFDKNQNAELTINLEGPDAVELREAWEEISKKEAVPLEFVERTEVDGQPMREYKSEGVRKGDERYPDAVWSYLESKYKFLVDKKH